MDFPGSARQIPKKRRTSTTKSIVQLPDLNTPPAEVNGAGIPSSSMAVSHNQASTSVPPAADGPQIGIQSFPIDVEAIDDDVMINGFHIDGEAIDDDVMICPSRLFPQTRRRSTRTERVIMIIDDEPETNPEPAGDALDEHVNTLLSLGINRRHVPPRASNNSPVITLLDTPEVRTIRATTIQATPAPVIEVPREPRFTCPVCLNELTEPSSTPCGHIFCKMCIKSAIQAQKKCPTCRRKLGNTSFHRVYLPTTTE